MKLNLQKKLFLLTTLFTTTFLVKSQTYEFQLVRDVNTNGSSIPEEITVVGETLFFRADWDSTYPGSQLWKSDGTESGTQMVGPNGFDISDPEFMVNYDGKLFFSAISDDDGLELWKTDGTATGTQKVKNINTGNFQGSSPSHLTIFNGKLYFAAANATYGVELWVSDGTTDGTLLLKDIRTGGASSHPKNFYPYNGKLYFSAFDGSNGFEL